MPDPYVGLHFRGLTAIRWFIIRRNWLVLDAAIFRL
jgi:hypothetical protein